MAVKEELLRLKQDVEVSTKESNWALNEQNPKYKYSSKNVTNSCCYGTYTYIKVTTKSWLMMLLVHMEKNWENASDKARSDNDWVGNKETTSGRGIINWWKCCCWYAKWYLERFSKCNATVTPANAASDERIIGPLLKCLPFMCHHHVYMLDGMHSQHYAVAGVIIYRSQSMGLGVIMIKCPFLDVLSLSSALGSIYEGIITY